MARWPIHYPFASGPFVSQLSRYLTGLFQDEEIIATFGPSEEGTLWRGADHYDRGVTDYLTITKGYIIYVLCPLKE